MQADLHSIIGTILIPPFWKKGAQLAVLFSLFAHCSLVSAQVVSVNTLQNLSFGTFSQGTAGGTITVSNTGTTTTTGSVASLSFGGINDIAPAIFEVEAPAGTIISVSNGPDASLVGSNGGTMMLHLGDSNPMTPFAVVNQTGKTNINLGGTISIGDATTTPPGAYSGTFYITINNE